MYVIIRSCFFCILWTKPRSCRQKNDFQKPAPDFFENFFENYFENENEKVARARIQVDVFQVDVF